MRVLIDSGGEKKTLQREQGVPGQFKNTFNFVHALSCACEKKNQTHTFKDNQAFRDIKVVSEKADNKY